MAKNRNVLQAMEYYRTMIESGREDELTKQEKKSILYLLLKRIFMLGDGDWEKGSSRLDEITKEQHEQELKNYPFLAKFESMLRSENLTDRAFAEFLAHGGMDLREEDGKEFMKRLLQEETYKSSMQPPAEQSAAKQDNPKHAGESKKVATKKRKTKAPALPTRKANALRWVITWEEIKPKLEQDSSLEINLQELHEWLKAKANEDISQLQDDTLRKIIKAGKAGNIPPRADFERENQM